MSNLISTDCSSRLHEYCTPCECPCHNDILKLDKQKAQALARVLKDQWINRDDMEAIAVVDEVCEFANPKVQPAPLSKEEK